MLLMGNKGIDGHFPVRAKSDRPHGDKSTVLALQSPCGLGYTALGIEGHFTVRSQGAGGILAES